MSNQSKVTISLLAWNGGGYFPCLLKSLQDQTFKDWELLVLDNDSSDNSVKMIEEYYPPAKIIKQKNNVGFSKGHNLLINWSRSDYILFLNQDIILEEDFLAKTVQFLEENPNAATVSSKLLYWNFPEAVKTKTIDSFGLKFNRKRQVVDDYQGKSDFSLKNKEVFGLSGALLLARREALETIKILKSHDNYEYFDEDFFSYKEDIDLAWRLRLRGWENWLIVDTRAYHHRTVSSNIKAHRKNRGIANKLSYRNHLAVLYKNSFAKNFFKDIHYILWYELKKFIYLLIFETSTLKGLLEFFKLHSKLKRKRKYIKKTRRVPAKEIYQWFK